MPMNWLNFYCFISIMIMLLNCYLYWSMFFLLPYSKYFLGKISFKW